MIRSGRKVATPNTPVRLVSESTPAKWLMIQGQTTLLNVLGGADVVGAGSGAVKGAIPHKSTTAEADPVFVPGPLDLYDVWLEGISPSDAVHFIYDERG